MRTLAILFGLVVLGGVVVMAVAGYPGALAILLTAAGIVGMIVLGTRLGGRGSRRRASAVPGDGGGSRPG